MPVSTTSAAIHITPVVIKTFFRHSKKKAKRIKNSSQEEEVPQDDILFDEAFHIVKAFIELGTKNTIESLQGFTNTHVPAPYWAAVCPVIIPLSSCNRAADALIEWFGPEELKLVVGGERWWQVRGLNGVDAEWIAEEKHLDSETETKSKDGKKIDGVEAIMQRMEKLDTVMLYIHGGGYFWGSINTHRYQILHYAHKFKGRAFAVNYRKAPQYPWPCALQDVIAAYLYLIRPPPSAPHKAIPHSKIIFAGDSAGGGLCLTSLTILRDLGLPMPAGAILISPWVDLTHSFPSVMQNVETDIIPKHGFLSKPSTLWPVPTQPENGGRVIPTATNDPPKPGKADTLKPSFSRVERAEEREVSNPREFIMTQQEMLDESEPPTPAGNVTDEHKRDDSSPVAVDPNSTSESSRETKKDQIEHDIDNWEPKPPKVRMENPNAVPLELRSQIQMYAATEQLTHPLVSPILQGSLGNLPPLYIIAGNGEVLRDEVIYLAHKAAHPTEYPTRDGVLRESRRQKENAEKFTKPTKVRLQVFDGMCHVLTVFTFTKSAKYAYNSIAEFAKHVTNHDEEYLQVHPFPQSDQQADSEITDKDLHTEKGQKGSRNLMKHVNNNTSEGNEYNELDQESNPKNTDPIQQDTPDPETMINPGNGPVVPPEAEQGIASSSKPSSATQTVFSETVQGAKDSPEVLMVRERVDIHAKVRNMEPRETLQALQLELSEIGIIKEAPALRWAEGQRKWDERYSRNSKRVLKQKAQYEAKAERMMRNALDQGFVHKSHGRSEADALPSRTTKPLRHKTSIGKIQPERRWGPLDLEDERPPATAIAGRRDTPEAVALLKKSIYHTAPVTHLTVPKLTTSEALRAAFDPDDDPNKAPTQSASEEQVKAQFIPIHGLRIWDNILRYLGRKSSAKAANGINVAAEQVGLK